MANPHDGQVPKFAFEAYDQFLSIPPRTLFTVGLTPPAVLARVVYSIGTWLDGTGGTAKIRVVTRPISGAPQTIDSATIDLTDINSRVDGQMVFTVLDGTSTIEVVVTGLAGARYAVMYVVERLTSE